MTREQLLIHKAREFARKKHNGQKDDSGKNYFDAHLEQVVRILYKITDDYEIITAGYLHDTLEDTNTNLMELKDLFGPNIAWLVYEVTCEKNEKTGSKYFPRLKSKKAVLIKFADRLSNLSRMDAWNQERQNHYIKKSKFWSGSESL